MVVGLQNMFGTIRRFFARTSVQRVAVICTVFATVISAGAYATSDRFGLFQWLQRGNGSGFGDAGQSSSPTGAASLSDDDPVKNFVKTGVGHVLFAATSSDNCRRTLFDNRTGATYEAGDILCGQTADQRTDTQSDRLQAFRKSTRR
jgi:hypothetical protein